MSRRGGILPPLTGTNGKLSPRSSKKSRPRTRRSSRYIKGTGPNFDIDTLTEEEKGKLFLLVQYHGKMKSSVAELAARIDDEKRASIAEKRIMPRIRIRDRVYPNVTLKIWGQTLVVKQQEFHVSFFMDKDRGVIARGGF